MKFIVSEHVFNSLLLGNYATGLLVAAGAGAAAVANGGRGLFFIVRPVDLFDGLRIM